MKCNTEWCQSGYSRWNIKYLSMASSKFKLGDQYNMWVWFRIKVVLLWAFWKLSVFLLKIKILSILYKIYKKNEIKNK